MIIQPAIVIACGGEGSRMGGDKPHRDLCGRSLLQRTCEWAKAHSDCVALAVRDATQITERSLPLLYDGHRDIGPITALASAFAFARGSHREFVLMIGCDQPFLPDDLVERLAAAIGDRGAALPQSGGRGQPLAALWRVDPEALARYIAAGRQSLHGFAHDVGAATVEWDARPDSDPFFNVNEPGALAEAERRIRKAAP